jgi:hypothetical protein
MQRAGLALALLCAAAASANAQAPRSIDPGMSQAQVVERFGEPDLSRTSGDFTYLFYKNGCVRSCGVDDLVILQRDSVVDAVLRATERAYTGKSSSPRAIPADVAARTRPGARDLPAPEVLQAGTPRPPKKADAPGNSDATATSDAPAKTDSVGVEPRTGKIQTRRTTKAPSAAPRPDTALRDSIIKGSLHIKVMPKNFTPPSRESVRPDSSKRPPHEE